MTIKRLILIILIIIVALITFVCATKKPIENIEVSPVARPVIKSAPELKSVCLPEAEISPKSEPTFYDVPFDLETQTEIIAICAEYGFSYELILGIISVESNFIPDILGDGGKSFGLMQIQPRWWSNTMEREGVTDLLDPLQNIRCGCAILRELTDKFDTEYRALQAYNTGRPDSKNGYAEKVYKHVGKLKIYGGSV